MSQSREILDRISQIASVVMEKSGESGEVRCLATEGDCPGGIPSNFIGAIRKKLGDDVADEFFSLITEFAVSFQKSDGTHPNVVKLHFEKGVFTEVELRSEYYREAVDRFEIHSWAIMKAKSNP